jgi:hypothetical protein
LEQAMQQHHWAMSRVLLLLLKLQQLLLLCLLSLQQALLEGLQS